MVVVATVSSEAMYLAVAVVSLVTFLLVWDATKKNILTAVLSIAVAGLAVLFDYIAHVTFFEPTFYSLIQQGLFQVEDVFYYGTKFTIVTIPWSVIITQDPQKKIGLIYRALATGLAGAGLFGLFYYAIRPLPPLDFAFYMGVNHFADIFLAVLLLGWLVPKRKK